MENMRNWNKISRNSQRNKTDDEEQSSVLKLLFDFQGPTAKASFGVAHSLRNAVVTKNEEKGIRKEPFHYSLFLLTSNMGV